MKNILKFAALAALSVTMVSAMAQGFPGGGGGGGGRQGRGGMRMMGGANSSFLLMRIDVRDDLALTDEQKDKLKDLQDSFQKKMMENFQAMRNNGGGGNRDEMRATMEKMGKEADAEVAKILTPEQGKRLNEIKLQVGGGRALMQEDVAKELGLTAEQKAKMKSLTEQADAANRSVFEKARNGEISREQIQETMEKNSKALDTEFDKLLTASQKTKLAEMKGKPFEEKKESR